MRRVALAGAAAAQDGSDDSGLLSSKRFRKCVAILFYSGIGGVQLCVVCDTEALQRQMQTRSDLAQVYKTTYGLQNSENPNLKDSGI